MKRIALWVVVLSAAGCSNEAYKQALRDSLEQSPNRLGDVVAIAETSMESGRGVTASLLVDGEARFSVKAASHADLHRVTVSVATGEVTDVSSVGSFADACPGSITLEQAIAIAEAEKAGDAVAIAPDDDDACNREVQVLAGDTLWEVKVGPGGNVLETEVSDDD